MTNKLLIIDTETGGFDATEHSILSLAAVVWCDRQLIDELQILVAEEPIRADPEAMKVNRIDLKRHTEVGLPPTKAVEALNGFLETHFQAERIELAGQNVGFDIAFLRRLYRLAKHDFERRFSHRSIDTASVMSFLILANVLPLRDASLNSGLAYFNIPMAEHDRHTAIGDARCTAQLLNRLLGTFDTAHTG